MFHVTEGYGKHAVNVAMLQVVKLKPQEMVASGSESDTATGVDFDAREHMANMLYGHNVGQWQLRRGSGGIRRMM